MELSGLEEPPAPAMDYLGQEFEKEHKTKLHLYFMNMLNVTKTALPLFKELSSFGPEFEQAFNDFNNFGKSGIAVAQTLAPDSTIKKMRLRLDEPKSIDFSKKSFRSIVGILADIRGIVSHLDNLNKFFDNSHRLLMMSHDNDSDAENFSEVSFQVKKLGKEFKKYYIPMKKDFVVILKKFGLDPEDQFGK